MTIRGDGRGRLRRIPDVSADDLGEIQRLLCQEHAYVIQKKEIIMGTTIVLVIVGVVILGVTIFSFQFSNGGSVSDTETGNETKNGSSK